MKQQREFTNVGEQRDVGVKGGVWGLARVGRDK